MMSVLPLNQLLAATKILRAGGDPDILVGSRRAPQIAERTIFFKSLVAGMYLGRRSDRQ
jgi:hypothetical protein